MGVIQIMKKEQKTLPIFFVSLMLATSCLLLSSCLSKSSSKTSSGQKKTPSTKNPKNPESPGNPGNPGNPENPEPGLKLLFPTQFASGSDHNCAILNNGKVKCWGYNNSGLLGQEHTHHQGDEAGEMGDNLEFTDLGANLTAKVIAAKEFHTCAILSNGKVKCWGDNNHGQLGQEHTNHRGDEAGEMGDNLEFTDLGTNLTAKAITAGHEHTCAILSNDKVKCWGYNKYGQLGQGDTELQGNEAGEMGDNLEFTDLGTNLTAKAIAAGNEHTCAILSNDKVKCWGYSIYGQLGQGDTDRRGDEAGEMGDNLEFTDLGANLTAKAITTGFRHTCVILSNDKVKCWGINNHGQLGQGHTNHQGDGADEMGDNLEFTDLGTNLTAKAITAGGVHTCAILSNDKVKCWGYNENGQLGQENTQAQGHDVNEMGDNLEFTDLGTNLTAKAITTGNSHTCAILSNDKIKCWGYNSYGQLGQGNTHDQGDEAGEMGEELAETLLE